MSSQAKDHGTGTTTNNFYWFLDITNGNVNSVPTIPCMPNANSVPTTPCMPDVPVPATPLPILQYFCLFVAEVKI